MECPSCARENPEDAGFCGECGASLVRRVACPSCGRDAVPGQKFCHGCGGRLEPAPSGEEASCDPEPRPESPSAPPPEPGPPSRAGLGPSLGGPGPSLGGGGLSLGSEGLSLGGSGLAVGSHRLPYTPRHLADKILRSRAALEGERKQVTVLFADIKGSTALAEKLDPETWHGVLDRFFHVLAGGVHRFEGTVNQYTGDGIMALFGAPIAHEDHAQRACRAALGLADELRGLGEELRRDRGFDLQVRMGLHTGDVVVGKIGDDLRMDYTAQGHTVNLASRLQEAAEPGAALLSEAVARSVEGYFALADRGELHPVGSSEPVRIFRLEGEGALRTRFDLSRKRGLATFVGREADMAVLETTLQKARLGQAQVVGVVGQAGIGKSRLCFEFAERCREAGVAVYEGHCQTHGRMVPYLPILELLRGSFGIEERQPPAQARDKIAARLLHFGEEHRDALPLLCDFLGVADPSQPPVTLDPEAWLRQLSAILRRIYQLETQSGPTLTLIEDLHWIDRSSAALLEILVDVVRGTRAVVVLNFRPEYRAEWMGMSHYHQLPLQPLRADAIDGLLGDLLGDDESLSGLAAEISARTAGNTLFVEEVVQELVESGSLVGSHGAYRLVHPVAELRVPASVQVLLASRIDRLAEREKHLLQTAAVLGMRFSEKLLAAVAELPVRQLAETLAVLRQGEFLYEAALYPDVEYAFKHPLTQEVALRSLLGARRQALHARAVAALRRERSEHLDDSAALIAHHLEEAGDLEEAAVWQDRAALWLDALDSHQAAVHWRRALSLLEKLGASERADALGIRIRRRLLAQIWKLGMDAGEAERLYREASELAERSGDLASLALVTWGIGLDELFRDRFDDFERRAREALEIAERGAPIEVQAALHYPAFFVCFERGLLDEALRNARFITRELSGTAGESRELLGFSPRIYARRAIAATLVEMGRLDEAGEEARILLADAENLADPEALPVALHTCIAVHVGRARADAALPLAQRGFEIGVRVGSPAHSVAAHYALADAFLCAGRFREAADTYERGLAIGRDGRVSAWMRAEAQSLRALALLGTGAVDRAFEVAEGALALARSGSQTLRELHARLALARVRLARGGAAVCNVVEAELDSVESLIETTGARYWSATAEELRGRIAHEKGQADAFRSHLERARELHRASGADGHVERLAAELRE